MFEILKFIWAVQQNNIPKLYGRLLQKRQEKDEELEDVNKIMIGDPRELAKFYIEPDCQEFNPADKYEEDGIDNRLPIMLKIKEFLKQRTFQKGGNVLFILSDTGMGKSALVTMMKLLQMESLWPKEKHFVLKKIGPETINEIKDINQRKTILLLDSLDEDQIAYGRLRERLIEILNATQYFAKVILTCRTQFFPKTEISPLKVSGKVVVDGFTCYCKYLSFFNDDMVSKYLSKRFPSKFLGLLKNPKKDEAIKIIDIMGPLKLRPLILSYIENLMNSPLIKEGDNEYKIYEALLKEWLLREAENLKNVPWKNIYDACIILAIVMHLNKRLKISESELNKLIVKISEIRPVKQIQMKGRSLLNRNSDGDYRFSHYSIQEFCVAKFLVENLFFRPKRKIFVTRGILNMILKSRKAPNSYAFFKESIIRDDSGTMLDTKTWLMWPKKERWKNFKWSEAKEYCKNYRKGGYDDWRLPKSHELLGFFKFLNWSGNNVFGNTSNFIWASERYDSEASCLTYGNDAWQHSRMSINYSYIVLPVRGGR